MKQENNYEDRIAEIKKYLKEKEDEVANNRASQEKRDIIRQKSISDSLVFDDDDIKEEKIISKDRENEKFIVEKLKKIMKRKR